MCCQRSVRLIIGSSAVHWLGQLFQQDLQKADEIETEAKRRGKLANELFESEKSWAELHNERKLKIENLREKIREARSLVRLNVLTA